MIDQHDCFFPEVVRPPSRQEQDGSDLLYPKYSGPCNARFTSTSFLAMAGAGVLVTPYNRGTSVCTPQIQYTFPVRFNLGIVPAVDSGRASIDQGAKKTGRVHIDSAPSGQDKVEGPHYYIQGGGVQGHVSDGPTKGHGTGLGNHVSKTHSISRQSYSPALWLTRRDSTAACTVSTAKRSFR
jgi:hypothetical protein